MADRQSQVDLYRPDLERFPRFAQARGVEAILQPGEVLYIPSMWFHHIECLDTPCTSVNFWFKCAPDDPLKVSLPLKDPVRLLSMRRNVEKITMKKLGKARAARFWDTLARWLKTRAQSTSNKAVPEAGEEEKDGEASVDGRARPSSEAGEVSTASGEKDRENGEKVAESGSSGMVSEGSPLGTGQAMDQRSESHAPPPPEDVISLQSTRHRFGRCSRL